MKLSKTNVITIKWIISFIIAIRVGTWIMNLLYTAPLNVWLAVVVVHSWLAVLGYFVIIIGLKNELRIMRVRKNHKFDSSFLYRPQEIIIPI